MRNAIVIHVSINRSFEESYGLLSEPRNYPLWSPVTDPEFQVASEDGLSYLVDLPRGRRILRFSPPNPFGVLDYTVLEEGQTMGPTTPVRLVPNEEGCELIVVMFQHDDQSDEKFRSDAEWLKTDFESIKNVVETLK